MSRRIRAASPSNPPPAERLAIIYRAIADLRPDPRNPRQHAPRQIKQISGSIEAFGFNVPILVDRDSNVIAGHGRLLACQAMGWTEVPTIALERLSPAQARAFMIADNRLTDTSVWDDALLASALKDLSLIDLEFSLEATGFSMGEIDLRIEGLDMPAKPDPADALPVLEGPPVTNKGDVWLLGPHRVACASVKRHPLRPTTAAPAHSYSLAAA